MPLADFQTLTDSLHRDDSGKITTADRDTAIGRAVARYSDDKPRTKVEDVATTGANVLPLPAGWQAEFSRVMSLEVPIGNVPPTIVDQDRYGPYQLPAGTVVLQLLDALNVGTAVRVSYTQRHTLDLATDTVPAKHREAVCCWAAALICEQLAALYANATDSTIQADVVDRSSKGRDYASRAMKLRQRYFEELGLDPKRNVAAGVEVNLNLPTSQGEDRLTHPRRYR